MLSLLAASIGANLNIAAKLVGDRCPLLRRFSERGRGWFAIEGLLYGFIERREVIGAAGQGQAEAARQAEGLCQYLSILAAGPRRQRAGPASAVGDLRAAKQGGRRA